ncbi:MAG: class I SAM-dependent methyltransferase [Solirubrobacteraceae bacterium]
MPLPPPELANRVGGLPDHDPLAAYLGIGGAIHDDFVSLLGTSWEWRGKRVLDFGCGSGRVLRHFLAEAEAGAQLYGCDIEEPGITWLRENLSPPIKHAFVNDERPPLPFPDRYFDLIWAASVFTHLAEGWSEWLLELHRLLSDGGLLIATFLGEHMSEEIAGEPWDENRIGMNVIAGGSSWVTTNILHSPWWIRAHWGRAFEILELRPSGFPTGGSGADPHKSHGVVLMQRREVQLAVDDLERLDADPREAAALRHNVRQLVNILAETDPARRAQETHDLQVALQTVISSRSWRLTRPLRAVGQAARRFR